MSTQNVYAFVRKYEKKKIHVFTQYPLLLVFRQHNSLSSGWQTYVIVTWVNDTEHTKIIDKQCRWEVEKG